MFDVKKALVLHMCQRRNSGSRRYWRTCLSATLAQYNGITFKDVRVDGERRLLTSDGATERRWPAHSSQAPPGV